MGNVPSLKKVLARAVRAGLSVEYKSGEVLVRDPTAGGHVVRANFRKKDAIAPLVKMVERAERRQR